MNADRIFNAFSSIDPILQTEAEAAMRQSCHKIRPRLRYVIIAATLALLVALIPIAVILASRSSPSHYKDINHLAGAQQFHNTDQFRSPDDDAFTDHAYDKSKYLQMIRPWTNEALSNHTAVFGKATDVSSVFVENGDGYYHIVTLTINVEANCADPQNIEPLKAVYACRYEKVENSDYYHVADPYTTCGLDFYQDMGKYFYEEETSLFLIDPIEGRSLDINDTTLDLSEYGNCYMTVYARVNKGSIELLSKRGFLAEENRFHNEAAARNSLYVKPSEFPAFSQIRGAEYITSVDNFDTSQPYILPPKDEFIKTVNEQYTVLTGNEFDVKHTLVPDGDLYWHMTTFTLAIQQHTANYNGKTSVEIMHAQQYQKENDTYIPLTSNIDYGFMLMKQPCGFYVLEKITDQRVIIGDRSYPLSDYADYLIVYAFENNFDSLIYSSDRNIYTEYDKIPYEAFGLYDPDLFIAPVSPIPQ